MRETYQSSFDQRYLMKPWGGNSILYTCQYAILTHGTSDALTRDQANTAITAFIASAKAELPTGESFSHDDMTAVVCLSKLYNLPFHKDIRLHSIDLIHRLHPRDIIFYLYSIGGIFRVLSLPFLWIASLCMIESVLNETYKTINERAVLATDGGLLTFVRLETFDLPITKAIIEFCLSKRNRLWSDYFAIYFGRDHLNYQLSKESEEL